MLPISAVESTLMSSVLSYLAPKMPLVTRFEITRLHKAYQQCATEILGSSNVRSVYLSLDGWPIHQMQLVGALHFGV